MIPFIDLIKGIKGWVVLLDDITKTSVIFYGFQGIALHGFHQVTFNKDTVSYEDISKKELSAEDIAMIKARETVLAGFKPLCSAKYDTIVLERKERITVYIFETCSSYGTKDGNGKKLSEVQHRPLSFKHDMSGIWHSNTAKIEYIPFKPDKGYVTIKYKFIEK